MTQRLIVLMACFVAAAAYVARAMEPERVPLRAPLAALPMQLGGWAGHEAEPLAANVLAVLGVDEYVSRYYVESPRDVVSLYVGYYQSQRQGDTMHSPMNCLPGAGWQPIETGRMSLAVPGRQDRVEVNRVLIQKGIERQVVLYWYQSHGRIVASEYWSKIFLVTDALRTNRSDGALVRVVSPVLSRGNPIEDAEARAVRFVERLLPQLDRHLPS